MTFHIINNYCYFLEKNEYKTRVNSDSYFIIVLKKHIVAFPAHFLAPLLADVTVTHLLRFFDGFYLLFLSPK